MAIPDSSQVRDIAKQAEDSNYRFRDYLKRHADEDELDSQFLQLHMELFASYDCSNCRNCCKEYVTGVYDYEADQIAGYLRITRQEFTDRYVEDEPGELASEDGPRMFLIGQPCCFLADDNSCQIKECMPSDCREFPHTNKPDRLASMLSIVHFASVCPVVFEMLEQLKKLYRFKSGRYSRY